MIVLPLCSSGRSPPRPGFTAKHYTWALWHPGNMELNRNVSGRISNSILAIPFPRLPCECNHRDFILIPVYLITILASALPASVALLGARCSSGNRWCVQPFGGVFRCSVSPSRWYFISPPYICKCGCTQEPQFRCGFF